MVNLDATTPQLKALKQVAEAFASRDLTPIEPLLSKDFSFKTFPEIADLPSLTGDGFLTKHKPVFGIFVKVEVTIHEVIEAPGKVVSHHTISCTTADGITYDYDSVGILTFVEEAGELKIIGAKDFADPDKRGAFYAGAAKALGVIAA